MRDDGEVGIYSGSFPFLRINKAYFAHKHSLVSESVVFVPFVCLRELQVEQGEEERLRGCALARSFSQSLQPERSAT